MNTYKAFFKSRTMEIKAETSYEAQQKAAVAFKAKKSYEVTVMLVAKSEEQVTHSTGSL